METHSSILAWKSHEQMSLEGTIQAFSELNMTEHSSSS